LLPVYRISDTIQATVDIIAQLIMLVKHITQFKHNMLYKRAIFDYNKGMITLMAKNTQRGSMDARISVTSNARNTLSGFIQGAGVKYDDVVRWFMESIDLDPNAGEEAGIRHGLKYRGQIPNYDEIRKQEIIDDGKQEDGD